MFAREHDRNVLVRVKHDMTGVLAEVLGSTQQRVLEVSKLGRLPLLQNYSLS